MHSLHIILPHNKKIMDKKAVAVRVYLPRKIKIRKYSKNHCAKTDGRRANA